MSPAPFVAIPEAAESDVEVRYQLSSLQGLLVVSMMMNDSGDEQRVLELVASSALSLARCEPHGVHLLQDGGRPIAGNCADPAACKELDAQLAVLTAGGAVAIPGTTWGWAYPLLSLVGHLGYFVVGADSEPTPGETFLLRVLAQQAGIALANARLHTHQRATTAELRNTNMALAETVAALERSTAIHDRLTRVAVSGEGQDGIARAVYELTGYSVAIEDRHGNLRAWAGPNRPVPYPKDVSAERGQMLRRARREGQPIRWAGRLLVVAQPRDDVVGILALHDPGGTAGEQVHVALEHGATVLATELSRLASIAETELRIGRYLVDALVEGIDPEETLAQAQGMGYDLERPHRVVVVAGRGGPIPPEGAFFHAVRRAIRDVGVGSQLMVRRGEVVLLADNPDSPWRAFRSAVVNELGGDDCRVGVGGLCSGPVDFPRSYREAQLAIKIQRATGGEPVTTFETLGIYRMLAGIEDTDIVEHFVREWLGPLLDYDAQKGSALVTTLSRYLECGRSHAATAAALSMHRSTLKYRLQRIRQLSGHDLSDPDTLFNLQLATRALHTLLALRSDPGAAARRR